MDECKPLYPEFHHATAMRLVAAASGAPGGGARGGGNLRGW